MSESPPRQLFLDVYAPENVTLSDDDVSVDDLGITMLGLVLRGLECASAPMRGLKVRLGVPCPALPWAQLSQICWGPWQWESC